MKGIIFAGCLLVATAAMAEGPCAKDRESLCAGVRPGEGRIAKCMKEKEAKLSADCKASMEKTKEQLKEIKSACRDDAQKLCPGKTKRQLMKCLRSQKNKVSETCRNEWKELRGKKG